MGKNVAPKRATKSQFEDYAKNPRGSGVKRGEGIRGTPSGPKVTRGESPKKRSSGR